MAIRRSSRTSANISVRQGAATLDSFTPFIGRCQTMISTYRRTACSPARITVSPPISEAADVINGDAMSQAGRATHHRGIGDPSSIRPSGAAAAARWSTLRRTGALKCFQHHRQQRQSPSSPPPSIRWYGRIGMTIRQRRPEGRDPVGKHPYLQPGTHGTLACIRRANRRTSYGTGT